MYEVIMESTLALIKVASFINMILPIKIVRIYRKINLILLFIFVIVNHEEAIKYNYSL